MADAARGDFAFKAANNVGHATRSRRSRPTACPGTRRARPINVNVVNDPPEITCTSLVAHEDTPLEIPVADCVTDPNNDPVTIDLDGATGGTVERVAGTWYFVPDDRARRRARFRHACSVRRRRSAATPRRVTVTIVSHAGPVTLDVTDNGKHLRELTRGAALRLSGTAVDAGGQIPTITWNFGDNTRTGDRHERRAPLPQGGIVHRHGHGGTARP